MKLRDILVVLFNAMGGTIQSKTKIQKLCYFLSVRLEKDFGFNAYYYGPYSQLVATALDDLVGMNFAIKSENNFGSTDSGFEVIRYDYSLTNKGIRRYDEIKNEDCVKDTEKFISQLKSIGNLDYVHLSIAAKSYFILKQEGKPMDFETIKKKSRHFNWDIKDQDIETAVGFLDKCGFVGTTS